MRHRKADVLAVAREMERGGDWFKVAVRLVHEAAERGGVKLRSFGEVSRRAHELSRAALRHLLREREKVIRAARKYWKGECGPSELDKATAHYYSRRKERARRNK